MELPQNEIFRRQKPPALLFSVRFLTCIVLFFGYCFQTMLKINLSIGLYGLYDLIIFKAYH